MKTRNEDNCNHCGGDLLLNERFLSKLEYVPVTHLKGYRGHARIHGRRKMQLLQNSIREYGGILVPILIESDGTLITGHARLRAAINEGRSHVPAIVVNYLSQAQIKAFRIADNRLVELGTWDKRALALEFEVLLDLDIDPTSTAFEVAEIDLTITDAATDAPAEDNPFDLLRRGAPISSSGRMWRLDGHLVLCGSALNGGNVERLMGGRTADMAFLDPPYNVRIDGHVGGRGRIHHPEFAMASGEMSDSEFREFLGHCAESVGGVLKVDGLAYFCIDWRSASLLDGVARGCFKRPVNWAVWVKNAPGQGSFLRSQCEHILIYCNGDGPFLNNIQLGRFGRNRSNVWSYPGTVGFNRERRAELELHPTPKPVAMVQDAILDCTRRREIVIDTFLGGGATLMACERSGRVCRGMEIDPHYVDVCVRRWQAETGGRAVCADTGDKFDDVAAVATRAPLMLPSPTEAEDRP